MQFFKKVLVSILTLESRVILNKYKPFIVAVTGSVGKTSTKDAIYCVLKNHFKYARKSEKSMNSEIGLPLTVIGVPNAWRDLSGWIQNIFRGLEMIMWRVDYPDCLVLEIGADHPGDIQNVAKWLKPHIAVITKVSDTPVHVEFFKSPEEVFIEKASLARAIRKDGTAILLADDAKVMCLAAELKEKGIKVISYGTNEVADIKAVDFNIAYENAVPVGISFNINCEHVVLLRGVVGETYMYPLLAATAVGKACNLPTAAIASEISAYEAPHGRMNLISGINGSIIIDDTYNSSPDAARSALETLAKIQTSGRKIAVLGDMMELGKFASEEHRKIGALAANVVNILVTVGQRSRNGTADEALKAGLQAKNIHSFDISTEAAEYVRSIASPGDLILTKGSQSMRMERVSRALLKEPEKAATLLVRQEKEWLEKK